ncbi:ROK family protein [Rathayibacter sp. VKM Ac-2856]|uniref:ROK family protein n=1 Tax=unclassified Rathayibacter TaxID=2609250 RepID=UPI00156653E1|nr:ROK family protein [Rathayibacter sp. VKM Ac-2858]NQX18592.1 ROK family protein [Rathayibacter sp. VKM Ac-2856]
MTVDTTTTTPAEHAASLLGGFDVPAGSVAPALEAAPLAAIIELVRTGRAATRPELVAASGLSRKIVTQRVEQALALGLLGEGGLAPSEGGRQARTLHFAADAGHVFAAVIGASEFTVAVSDLSGTLLATGHEDWSVANGPQETLERVRLQFERVAASAGVSRPWGIVIGVPGPVEYGSGRLVAPPIMPGWHDVNVRAWFRDHYDAPVWVDNDVNLMALGEWAAGAHRDGRDMLFVKVGTGVGAGMIIRGRLIRGERGGAGDIGHVKVSDDPAAVCRCGRVGCLEAVASGWSLLHAAQDRARESPLLAEVVDRGDALALGDLGRAALEGDPLSMELLTSAGRIVAGVVANLVNVLNPGVVAIGGGVLRGGEYFVDLVTDAVRSGCTDLVAERLVIRAASLDQLEGVTGAALLAIENVLAPAGLTQWVGEGVPFGHATALQRYAGAFN